MANCSTGPRTAGSVTTVKLYRKPSLEPGQRFITRSQHTGVFEHAAQMVDRFVRTGFVEADMGQRDLPLARPVSSSWTRGERFQVRMLAGRSTRHNASTIGAIASRR